MSVGTSIMALMGKTDPRQQLIDAIVQGAGGGATAAPTSGTGGAPYAAQPAAQGGQQAAPAQPDALTSPPDLSKMYADLINYNSKASNIDRGFGLIGSAISQDGNRQSTLQAFTGDAPTSNIDPTAVAQLAINLQKAKASSIARAAMLASLPDIARKYNLDPQTARYLMESGKLDEVISNAEKPNMSTQTDAQGRITTINQNTGGIVGSPVGPAKSGLKLVDGPDGSKYYFDEMSGKLGGQAIAPGTDTNSSKEYNTYFNDEITRGTPPDQVMSYQQFLDRPKPPTSQVNITNKQESAFASKYGESQAKRLDEMVKGSDNARDMLQSFDLIKTGLDSGINTGTFGESEQSLRKFGLALGIAGADDAKKVAGGELVQKISNQLALQMRNPESGMGMPGSLSDRDMAFLKQSQVGLSGSPGGNAFNLEAMRRMQERKIQVADMAEKYADEHGSLVGFSSELKKYSDANPLFADMKIEDYLPKDPAAARSAAMKKYGLE